MDEQKTSQQPVHKREMTDEEILRKAGEFLKNSRKNASNLFDELQVTKPMRYFIVVLMVLNIYLLLVSPYFGIFGILYPFILFFPFLFTPYFYYGPYIIMFVLLSNIVVSTLFLMRYRSHKVIFVLAIVVLIFSCLRILFYMSTFISILVLTFSPK